jgi:hypothetical protein
MSKRWFIFILVIFPMSLFAQDNDHVMGLKLFYAWWMIVTGAIFGFIFYLLWRMKNAEKAPKDKIEGILWFSRALAVWSISGLLELLVLQSGVPVQGEIGIILFKSIFSTLNSVFILFVIPSVEVNTGAPWLLKEIISLAKNKLGVIVGGIFVFVITALIFGLFQLLHINETNPIWYWLYVPDILYSLFTILALLLVFRAAFRDEKRHVSQMVWVVYLTILLTTLAEVGLTVPAWQILPADATEEYWIFYNLVATVFKMLLITLFVILLYSYEIKKAEEQKIAELLSDEEIKQRWSLEEKEVIVLRRLAKGETREAIGSDLTLFPPKNMVKRKADDSPLTTQRTLPRKNVDDLLQYKIAPKLRLPNQQQVLLLFALQNKIIQFDHPTESNFPVNITSDNSTSE